MLEPLLLAPEFSAPLPIIIAIVLIVVGLLVLRFIIKTAFTLAKIALLVVIGVAAYLGIAYLMDVVG